MSLQQGQDREGLARFVRLVMLAVCLLHMGLQAYRNIALPGSDGLAPKQDLP